MHSLIDLHTHSLISDGVLAPKDLVQYAASKGIRVLALTDHDDLAGLEEASSAAQDLGIEFIHGVEISVTWRGRTIHIVGLRVDPNYPPLVEGLKTIRAGRHVRAQGIAHSLEEAGISGALEGAYHYAKAGIISRTHFARFLIEKGYAPSMQAVFKRYLVKGKPGYFKHEWADLEKAIGWIKGAGGVAVIAHPGRYDMGRVTLLELFEAFRAAGGEAIEVVTGSHTPDQYTHFAKLAHQFSLCSSVGSDFHGQGASYIDIGRVPLLPEICQPVWHNWPELQALTMEI
jgi:3',5'-nucleoside bisphosphate phosphatase